MKKYLTVLLVFVAAALCSGDAFAFAKKKKPDALPRTSPSFSELDKDMDGKMTLKEYKVGFPDAKDIENEFKALDTNGDGTLSISEYKAGHPDPVPQKKPKKNGKKKA